METFLSNRIEYLYEELKKRLFVKGDPLLKQRVVIVPSPLLKKWLAEKLADDFGIAMGICIVTLNQAIGRLAKKPRNTLPSSIALALAIQAEIATPEFVHLAKTDKQRAHLSRRLARVFQKYGDYGTRLLAGFKVKSSLCWQGRLFCKVFGESQWTYPQEQLLLTGEKSDAAIYLFALQYLPELYYHFFCRLGASCYMLSPCALFWSEERSLREGSQEFSGHPLLVNFGKMGREMIRVIEESQDDYEACYYTHKADEELSSLPFSSRVDPHSSTALCSLQFDVLKNQSPTPVTSDKSVQVHAAPNKFREADVVYDVILEAFHTIEGLKPEEILICAPLIERYLPAINRAFNRVGEKIPYRVYEQSLSLQNPYAFALTALLKAALSHWECGHLMELFQHECFCNAQRWGSQEKLKIRRWIAKASIRWGYNKEHKELISKRDFLYEGEELTEIGTWDYGFKRLLMGAVVCENEQYPPVDEVDFSDLDLLGSLMQMMHAFYEECAPLVHSHCLTYCEWVDFLQNMAKTYFCYSEPDEKLEQLLTALEELRIISPYRCPFAAMAPHIFDLLEKQKKPSTQGAIDAIQIASLFSARAFPAKVLIVMGLDDRSFPRKENDQSLNLLKEDYCPTETEFDRFLLFETLLSAREQLIFTYPTCDDKAQRSGASFLVSEFQQLLGDRFFYEHPERAYDPAYFTTKSSLTSYSRCRYRTATAYCNPNKTSAVKDCALIGTQPPLPKRVRISLKQLTDAVCHPLRHYVRHQLGVYLPRLNEDHQQEEDPPYLLKSKLIAATFEGEEAQISLLQKMGKFPIGVFGEAQKQQISALYKAFQEPFSTLVFGEEEPLGPLIIRMEETEILISGKIFPICKKGLVMAEKDAKKSHLKKWPEYLAFLLLREKHALPFQGELISLHEGTAKSRCFPNLQPIEELKCLLRFYFSFPLPLNAEGIEKGKMNSQEDEYLLWALGEIDEEEGEKICQEYRESVSAAFKTLLGKKS